MKKLAIIIAPLLVLALVAGAVGCGGEEATPTPQPTAKPTAAPTATPGPGQTPASATPTAAPTAAPSPTPRPEPIVFKLAHGYPTGSFVDSIPQKFKELTEEYTDGLVQIEIFPMGTLVADYLLFDAVSTGIADMGLPSDWVLQPVLPDWYIQWFIWWWDSMDHIEAFFQHPDGGQKMLKELEVYNMKGLFIVPNTTLTMVLSKGEEVTSFYDLQGMRIRSVAGIPGVPYDYVGASSMQIAYTEMITAYEQGVVDAIGTDADSAIVSGHDKISDSAFIFPYMLIPMRTLLVNMDKWNKVSADLQAIIEDRVVPELVEWAYPALIANEEAAAAAMEASIPTAYQTKAEKDELRDAIWPLTEQYWSQIDPDLIDLVNALRP
ncbi:TRAP transporter substrate-binding protein DctP [Chloroflexota bacterium]